MDEQYRTGFNAARDGEAPLSEPSMDRYEQMAYYAGFYVGAKFRGAESGSSGGSDV